MKHLQVNVVGQMLANSECYVRGDTLVVKRPFGEPPLRIANDEKLTIAIWLSPSIEPKGEYVLDDYNLGFETVTYIFKRTDDVKLPTMYCGHVTLVLDNGSS